MWPIGQYDRLYFDIKNRKYPSIPLTFGILVADYRQRKAREYILNYIERFDYLSGKNINFYVPGYVEVDSNNKKYKIKTRTKKYNFDAKLYLEFLDCLEKDFEISYPYNPVLILCEYSNGDLKDANRIQIELDSDGSKIEQTGKLFEKIFYIAQDNIDLYTFSSHLQTSEIKNSLLNTIISSIDNSIVTAIYEQFSKTKKYKILSK